MEGEGERTRDRGGEGWERGEREGKREDGERWRERREGESTYALRVPAYAGILGKHFGLRASLGKLRGLVGAAGPARPQSVRAMHTPTSLFYTRPCIRVCLRARARVFPNASASFLFWAAGLGEK